MENPCDVFQLQQQQQQHDDDEDDDQYKLSSSSYSVSSRDSRSTMLDEQTVPHDARFLFYQNAHHATNTKKRYGHSWERAAPRRGKYVRIVRKIKSKHIEEKQFKNKQQQATIQ